MYNLSVETSGHYVIEDLHRTLDMTQEFRLSYYREKSIISKTFYVGIRTPYTYSLDTRLWFPTMEEMVAHIEEGLSPLRSHLSLKMLSGDMLEVDLDYGNVDYSPYQQINNFLRRTGIMRVTSFEDISCHVQYSIFDENGVKNLNRDIIHDGQEMNIFIH